MYELSNHLGNALVVITDVVAMSTEGSRASVVNASDYHPFGLEMNGRVYSDTISYRHGFNGKENDLSFGNLVYDYGFRIYNPSIGRFLSVDPLTSSYPSWSPYPFAMNRPIDGIDLDGLEFVKYDSKNTATIIFEVKRDQVIEQEYQAAMKSKMNVMVADKLSEMVGYFNEKGTTYDHILFGGHGPFNRASIKMGKYMYRGKYMDEYEADIKAIGSFVKSKGSVILLAYAFSRRQLTMMGVLYLLME